MRIAYLGPAATFTEAALIHMINSGTVDKRAERVPVTGAQIALAGLATGDYDAAVVPIENSLEGGVPATLDALTNNGDVRIVAEALIQVTFVLAVKPGTALNDIRTFATHPHAEAQTRTWISEHLPDVQYVPAPSTAAAAKDLGTTDVSYQAAICPQLAADTYGLNVLAHDIGSIRNAVTRFVLVKPHGALPQPTGADKTTIVATLSSDRAGALLGLLEQFSARGVNMSRIESRPTGDGLGLYKFSIDISGHVSEPRIAESLAGVHRVARKLQFLGSYPAADAIPVTVDPTTTAQSFTDAQNWLDNIVKPASSR